MVWACVEAAVGKDPCADVVVDDVGNGREWVVVGEGGAERCDGHREQTNNIPNSDYLISTRLCLLFHRKVILVQPTLGLFLPPGPPSGALSRIPFSALLSAVPVPDALVPFVE